MEFFTYLHDVICTINSFIHFFATKFLADLKLSCLILVNRPPLISQVDTDAVLSIFCMQFAASIRRG